MIWTVDGGRMQSDRDRMTMLTAGKWPGQSCRSSLRTETARAKGAAGMGQGRCRGSGVMRVTGATAGVRGGRPCAEGRAVMAGRFLGSGSPCLCSVWTTTMPPRHLPLCYRQTKTVVTIRRRRWLLPQSCQTTRRDGPGGGRVGCCCTL